MEDRSKFSSCFCLSFKRQISTLMKEVDGLNCRWYNVTTMSARRLKILSFVLTSSSSATKTDCPRENKFGFKRQHILACAEHLKNSNQCFSYNVQVFCALTIMHIYYFLLFRERKLVYNVNMLFIRWKKLHKKKWEWRWTRVEKCRATF